LAFPLSLNKGEESYAASMHLTDPKDMASSRNLDRSKVLRVVTLNMGSLFEPDWPTRRMELVAWLQDLDADIVCLQEVWETDAEPNTASWIVDQFPANHWHWAFGGPEVFVQGKTDPIRFGSAILSRRTIEESHLDLLPIDKKSGTPEVFRMPMELFSVRTGGVDVYSTHLALLRDRPTTAFARSCLSMRQFAPANAARIVSGQSSAATSTRNPTVTRFDSWGDLQPLMIRQLTIKKHGE
jgi:endonuclease/exonuclease/phosphatase family metal-dependent hydrolase